MVFLWGLLETFFYEINWRLYFFWQEIDTKLKQEQQKKAIIPRHINWSIVQNDVTEK